MREMEGLRATARAAALAVAAVMLPTGFAAAAGNPGQVAMRAAQAEVRSDFAAYYALVCAKDRAVLSREEFEETELSRTFFGLDGSIFADRAAFRLEGWTVTGSAAEAAVVVTEVDWGEAFQRAAAEMDRKQPRAKKMNMGEFRSIVLGLKGLPSVESRIAYRMVREKGEWRLDLGWAEDARCERLLEEAGSLKASGKAVAAAARYREALALRPDDREIRRDLERMEEEAAREAESAAADAEKRAVMKAVTVEGFGVTTIEGLRCAKGTIRNASSRAVSLVRLEIAEHDGKGARMTATEQYAVGENLLSEDVVQPGGTMEFVIVLPDSSGDWKGDVNCRILDLNF
jgi:hypothetical protein